MIESITASEPVTPSSRPSSQRIKKPLAPRVSKLEHLPAKEPSKKKILEVQKDANVKSDVHLRSDLVQPQKSYSCTSLSHTGYTPSFGADVPNSREIFRIGDMVDVGRPERDHSLRIPMMIYKNKMRKYKSGVRDTVKQALLMERIGDAARTMMLQNDPPGTEGIVIENAPYPGKVSEHFSIDDSLITDQKAQEFSRSGDRSSSKQKEIVVRSNSKLHLFQMAEIPHGLGMPKGGTRHGALNELNYPSSLPSAHLFKPASTAVEEGGVAISTKVSSPTSPLIFEDSFHAFSADPLLPPRSALLSKLGASTLRSPKPHPIYSPSKHRLPKTAPVPGFGDNPEDVTKKLGAYWVHSNKAVAAAAALELSCEVSLNNSEQGEGDTFHGSEQEQFLQRNLEQAANSLEMKTIDDSIAESVPSKVDADEQSVSTVNVSISKKSDHTERNQFIVGNVDHGRKGQSSYYKKYEGPDPSIILDDGNQINSVTESISLKGPNQQKLTCSRCLQRGGSLWCQECAAAFCGSCWVKVPHHELKYMLFEDPPLTSMKSTASKRSVQLPNDTLGYQSMNRSNSPSRRISSSHRARSGSPTNRNSYGKSVLFSGYYPGEDNHLQSIPKEKKYDSRAPAMIPLPDEVVLEYEDYPQCVMVDGKGNVVDINPHSEAAHSRPYTSPATPTGLLNRLHFQNDSKLNKILNGGLTPESSAPAGGGAHAVRARSTNALRRTSPEQNPSLGYHKKVKYSGRYRGKLMPGSNSVVAMQHSLGKVTVKRGQRPRSGTHQHIPTFSAGDGGTTSFAYSLKPSTAAASSRPTSKNPHMPPEETDWLEDLFKFDDPISVEPYNDDPDIFKRSQQHADRKAPNTPKTNPVPQKRVEYYDHKMVYVRPSLRNAKGSGKFSRSGSQKVMNANSLSGKFTTTPNSTGSAKVQKYD